MMEGQGGKWRPRWQGTRRRERMGCGGVRREDGVWWAGLTISVDFGEFWMKFVEF